MCKPQHLQSPGYSDDATTFCSELSTELDDFLKTHPDHNQPSSNIWAPAHDVELKGTFKHCMPILWLSIAAYARTKINRHKASMYDCFRFLEARPATQTAIHWSKGLSWPRLLFSSEATELRWMRGGLGGKNLEACQSATPEYHNLQRYKSECLLDEAFTVEKSRLWQRMRLLFWQKFGEGWSVAQLKEKFEERLGSA